MKAKLTKENGLFLLAIETDDDKGLVCLPFTDWLPPRVIMDNMKDSLSIDSIRDYTGGAIDHGYPPTKGVDCD